MDNAIKQAQRDEIEQKEKGEGISVEEQESLYNERLENGLSLVQYAALTLCYIVSVKEVNLVSKLFSTLH